MIPYIRSKLPFLGGVLTLIIIWEILTYYINPILLPKPIAVLVQLKNLLLSADLYISLSNTLLKTYLGSLLAIFLGVVLGVIVTIVPYFDKVINPFTAVIQSAPIISWILLTLIWFDNSIIPIIVIIFSTFPIVFVTVRDRVFEVEKETKSFVKVFRINRSKKIKGIYLPSIYIALKSCARVVMELSLKIAVMAEVISNCNGGVGELLNDSWINIDTIGLLSYTFILIIFTYLNVKLINLILKRVYRSVD